MSRSLRVVLCLSTSIFLASPPGRAADDAARPRIVGITICSHDGASLDANPECPYGTYETQQIVKGEGGGTINADGVKAASDEHSSVFPPGYLGDNGEYLLFVASGYQPVNRDIGLMVLSSSGPDDAGQWTFHLADGYGDYGANGRGAVFLSPTAQGQCPDTLGQPANQDLTFDLAYAAPGSLFRDPTSESGRLLMIYEGTNACVGNAGGDKLDEGAYESTGIATSLDGGRAWPRYRANDAPFANVDLPFANPSQGPRLPAGALGARVCIGNDCDSRVPRTYGRYEILTPPVPLDAALMSDPQNLAHGLGQNVGNSEPSAFVDDVLRDRQDEGEDDGLPFVYVVFEYVPGLQRVTPAQYQLPGGRNKDVMVARARLDPSGRPLTFFKWNGSSWSDPGLGGLGAGVFQNGDTAFEHCADPSQERGQASISYVAETREYLLTFVCNSPGPPHGYVIDPDATHEGSVWFYSTIDDLSDESKWSVPREITGSWARWSHHDDLPREARCPVFNGFYPTLMSPGRPPGQLSTQGYVFYLWGSLGACQAGSLPPGEELPDRKFTSRQFQIITGDRARVSLRGD